MQDITVTRMLVPVNVISMAVLLGLFMTLGFNILSLFTAGFSVVMNVVSLLAYRRAIYPLSSWLSISSLVCTVASGMMLNGGLHAPAVAALSIPTLLAGCLIGRRPMISVSVALCLYVFLVAYLDFTGRLQTPMWTHGPWSRAIVHVAVLIVFTFVMYWLSKVIEDSQTKLQTELTERMRAESEVRAINLDLEERVAARTADLVAFNSMVSHDLRGPLRHSIGYAKILQEDKSEQLDEEANQYLDRIVAASQRMTTLIDSFLSFSRIGHDAVKWETFDMAALVDDVWASMNETHVKFDLGELGSARGDRQLIRQVWQNLLENAVKYSRGSSGATIKVSQAEIDGRTWFVVEDNGVGFDPKYADKLFDMFSRFHSGPEHTGNGVGLAIVKRIVTIHHGEVRAMGEEGKGARFEFRLGEAG